MILLSNILIYLSIALGGSIVFSSLGYALRSLVSRDRNGIEDDGIFELVLYFALGIAITCFLCLGAALLHAFYWYVVIVPVVLFIGLAFLREKGANAIGFARLWRSSLRDAGWLPFVIALAIALPSVLPDITSDGQAFHLIYSKEWADAHALTIDPFIREPLYAMNWLTLDALFELLGLGWYTPVLSGLCYVWSVLAIFAVTKRFAPFDREERRSMSAFAMCFVATFSFALSPTVMHWALTGLVDGPIGFFFIVSAMAAMVAFEKQTIFWQLAFAMLAGYFVGMKTSLFLFFPLWICLSIVLGLRNAKSWKPAAFIAITMIVFGSPWYVRNSIIDGDPLAPTLNLLMTGHDAFWSRHDLAGQVSDLGTNGLAIERIALLPGKLFFDTMGSFREYGTSLSFLLLYVPAIFLVLDVVRARQKKSTLLSPEVSILLACSTYAVVYYLATSTLARYAMLFAPALSACLGIIAVRFIRLSPYRIGAVLALAIIALPSPASYSWLSYNEQFILQGLSLDRPTFLLQRLDGYAAATYVSDYLRGEGLHSGVYEVGSGNLCLVLRRGGNGCVGDWTGPSRFEDLDIAVHEGRAQDYVRRFDIGAFIIRTGGGPISNLTVAMLDKELTPLRFRRVHTADDRYIVIVRQSRS